MYDQVQIANICVRSVKRPLFHCTDVAINSRKARAFQWYALCFELAASWKKAILLPLPWSIILLTAPPNRAIDHVCQLSTKRKTQQSCLFATHLEQRVATWIHESGRIQGINRWSCGAHTHTHYLSFSVIRVCNRNSHSVGLFLGHYVKSSLPSKLKAVNFIIHLMIITPYATGRSVPRHPAPGRRKKKKPVARSSISFGSMLGHWMAPIGWIMCDSDFWTCRRPRLHKMILFSENEA